jgi:hypothetical protein
VEGFTWLCPIGIRHLPDGIKLTISLTAMIEASAITVLPARNMKTHEVFRKDEALQHLMRAFEQDIHAAIVDHGAALDGARFTAAFAWIAKC